VYAASLTSFGHACMLRLRKPIEFLCFNCNFFFAPLWRMGPRCSSAETQVCHRSYIIAARQITAKANHTIGFLRRSIHACPKEVKEAAYTTLVRP
jgi:hypothetical protein